jgi:hypothetical protein
MILALLQLTNGRINLGSLSFRSPKTGLRKTATRSELEVSGARSPTKMLYSLGYCCKDPVEAAALDGKEVDMGETDGTEDAQLRTKGFAELGMVTGFMFPLLIWARTDAACAGVGNVRKQ